MKPFSNHFCRFTVIAGASLLGSLGVYSSFSKAQELIPFPSPRPAHQVDQATTTQAIAPAATTAPSAVGQLIPFPVVRPNYTGRRKPQWREHPRRLWQAAHRLRAILLLPCAASLHRSIKKMARVHFEQRLPFVTRSIKRSPHG